MSKMSQIGPIRASFEALKDVLVDMLHSGGRQCNGHCSCATFMRGAASSGYGAFTSFRGTPTGDSFFIHMTLGMGMVPAPSTAQRDLCAA